MTKRKKYDEPTESEIQAFKKPTYSILEKEDFNNLEKLLEKRENFKKEQKAFKALKHKIRMYFKHQEKPSFQTLCDKYEDALRYYKRYLDSCIAQRKEKPLTKDAYALYQSRENDLIAIVEKLKTELVGTIHTELENNNNNNNNLSNDPSNESNDNNFIKIGADGTLYGYDADGNVTICGHIDDFIEDNDVEQISNIANSNENDDVVVEDSGNINSDVNNNNKSNKSNKTNNNNSHSPITIIEDDDVEQISSIADSNENDVVDSGSINSNVNNPSSSIKKNNMHAYERMRKNNSQRSSISNNRHMYDWMHKNRTNNYLRSLIANSFPNGFSSLNPMPPTPTPAPQPQSSTENNLCTSINDKETIFNP